MDFRKLKYVLMIAKCQNLTKAAEALYVGQPTLSKFLVSLEEELGVKLFKRLGNRYMLTYAGERYVEKAGEILRMKNDLDAEIADIIRRDVGVLNVAYARMRYTYMLPSTLPEFSRMHPNVRINAVEGTSDRNDRLLLDGQIDVAFYSMPGEKNPLIEYIPLAEEELLICTCKGHPLGRLAEPNPYSRYPKLDLSLLQNERVILMQPDQRTRQTVEYILKNQGLQYENVMCVSSIHAIIGLVANGYGVSFVFDTHLDHNSLNHQVERYSFGQNRTTSHFVAAVRKNSYLPLYVKDYIEIVRKQASSL